MFNINKTFKNKKKNSFFSWFCESHVLLFFQHTYYNICPQFFLYLFHCLMFVCKLFIVQMAHSWLYVPHHVFQKEGGQFTIFVPGGRGGGVANANCSQSISFMFLFSMSLNCIITFHLLEKSIVINLFR